MINIIGARQSVMRTKERHSGQGVRMSPNFEAGEEVELSRDQEEEKELVEQTPANSHCKILRRGEPRAFWGYHKGQPGCRRACKAGWKMHGRGRLGAGHLGRNTGLIEREGRPGDRSERRNGMNRIRREWDLSGHLC